ncbi:MAG: UDP-N-acetylmuramate dehydrogenase [Chloroflexota bacterium]
MDTKYLSEPQAFGVNIERDVSLATLTTMKVGGTAEYFATPQTVSQLISLVRWSRRVELPYFMLGGGSNMLISDAGIRGLVIHNRCRQVRLDDAPCSESVVDDRPYLFTESGTVTAGLARTSIRYGLTGLEWAVSVPGTIGGAVVGNAGAHGGEVKDTLANILLLDDAGEVVEMPLARLDYRYRHSSLKQSSLDEKQGWRPLKAGFSAVVLSANFRLDYGDMDACKAKADGFLAHRRRTQPVEPSLGSTFMNPPGDYAGRLIEAAGLKGTQIGGVQVSTQHANFIVNPAGTKAGGGRASDVRHLIEHIQEVVQTRMGVQLIPEIQIAGEW